ncbi:hypothetical protein HF086_014324 [Spodoptera exigua]|uniref:Uncharacterized protein n=1 Tax=Spodoptera exigua TaxID=7107 RepID=A0A922MKM6_SPOEX|nr:hypothetical protein HF086_014324 [Spodoptera exigua]
MKTWERSATLPHRLPAAACNGACGQSPTLKMMNMYVISASERRQRWWLRVGGRVGRVQTGDDAGDEATTQPDEEGNIRW